MTYRPTLWIIGGSSVRIFGGNKRAWGSELSAALGDDRVIVENRGHAGKSSRTFLTDGRWEKARTKMREGDFLLLEFGHLESAPLNEAGRSRGTVPGIGSETVQIVNSSTGRREIVHTFGWYLRQYILGCRAIGVTPILCTTLPRNYWNGANIQRGRTLLYAQWMHEIGREMGVSVIDSGTFVTRKFEQLGQPLVNGLFTEDNVHTNFKGAKTQADWIGDLLRGAPSALQPVLLGERTAFSS